MSTIRTYHFNERLAMSHGVATEISISGILQVNIPGALSARTAERQDDRNGTDWWVEHESGRQLSIDCKVREQDWAARRQGPADDLAIETWSVVGKKLGWSRDPRKRTDYVLWLWMDSGRWCLVPFPMLCAVTMTLWEQWIKDYGPPSRQFTRTPAGGYHSECVFVPRREIWRAIYERFAGSPRRVGIEARL